ncbi:related to bem3-gtpase-activating protein [Lichtheimia corymbifera JMRC:FSU:9682]|uniref:Related to bem3-gtpase-activating protein n=1 Tax=Lichtheimia corymbifera JMRC:FSU:9682 TaxID=1263082 RepID=A0A068S944_9FUNG|nr:related to bem3-gtpase-activating protein [Lichtheimia corymbifera JMRC:FSU:9682]
MASKVAPSNEDGNDLDASCHTLRTCGRLRQSSQDEELRKVIEKQRIVIRDLRKALAKVTADRDNLLAKFDTSSSNNAATGDRPPAATPVQHEMLMMMSDEDDALSTSPSTSSCCSTASSSNPTTTGPVPPPRSPFRQHNIYNNNQHHPTSPISSSNNSAKEQLTEDPSSTPHRVDSLSSTCASGRRNPNTRSSSLPVASFKRSISPTTAATMMVNNSPVSAILDKDKQLFARYQESMQRTTVTNGDHVECSTKTSISSAGDISTHDDDLSPSANHHHQQQWLWPSPPPIPPSERKMSTSTYNRRHVRRASSQPAIVTSTSSSLRKPTEKKIDRLLDGVSVKVLGSNITTNDKGKGVVSFTISVGQNADKELWCIEKRYSHFLTLDTKLKSQCKSKTFKTTKLPDKALFATHAPSKADQRKHAIEKYLQRVIEVPWPDLSVLHDFLNTDKTYRKEESQQTRPGYKAGYLTRRGKSFVGWKTRYFVFENGVLRYYDNPEGALLGTILIPDAQIRSSNSQSSSHEPHHAFLIVEPKKAASPGSGVYRHLLCAESDKERDEWVDVLTQAKKDAQDASTTAPYHPPRANSADSAAHHEYHHDDERPPLRQRSSMDQVYMPTSSKKYSITSSVGSNRRGSVGSSSRPCSPSTDDQEGGGLMDGKKKKGNRRTFWSKKMATGIPSTNSIRGLLSRNSTDTSADTSISSPQGASNGKNNPSNKVFGVPLGEAVRASRVSDTCHLPAIVVRCIEYLEANNATREEGIYRLSGSAVKIRSLREEFDQGTDVNLLESNEHHDIHAVAGVFKMWLRELPGNVLTEELLPEFLPVIDLVDRHERVQELGRLVSMLPLANYALLRSLCTHLIGVVTSSETNKMNARNVGIIFSPTLQIPTGIFNLFLSEFQYIFMTDNNDMTIAADSNKIQLDSVTGSSLSTSSTINTDPLHPTQPLPRVQHTVFDEQGRSNRNSVHYMNGTPFSIVGLEKGNAHVGDDDEVDDLDFHNDTLDDDNEPTSSNGSLRMSESFHSNDSKPDMTTTSFTASGQLLAMK